ncbi:MAG: TetR/AcrR family transcriptional regulator [Pseudomonadota bacterium]|nr:TetR/AcrR family transcriptional regulator [Pseudomonadota bacterium]
MAGAINFLTDHGVDSLRLDRLAQRLGVTKGSFYWHFESREELLEVILRRWREGLSIEVAGLLGKREGKPLDRLRQLMTLAFADRPDVPGGPLEMTLRGWARSNARVREIIRHADASRIANIQSLYLEAGINRERASAYAVIHVTFVTASRMMLAHASRAQLDRSRDIGIRYLIDRLDSDLIRPPAPA